MSRMKRGVAIPVVLIGLFRAAVVQAQVAKKQLDAVRANFKAPQDFSASLQPTSRRLCQQKEFRLFPTLGLSVPSAPCYRRSNTRVGISSRIVGDPWSPPVARAGRA